MENNSVETANNNVINLLADAGADGLHEDDILYLLGFQDKKHLNFRLCDLKGRSQITDLPGGRWKKCQTKMNGTTTEHTAETFITPSLTEELPSIYLPGVDKFSSYKNTLQEYCQKKHMPVPQYKVAKEGGGLIGTVTFALNHVRSEVIAGSLKEAEARVAYEALRKIGYMKDNQFDMNVNQLKRKEAMGEDYAATIGKKVKKERQDGTPKSMLNEYAQKNQKTLPTYNTLGTAAGGFFATVKFDGQEYKGQTVGTKRRDAEQNAASVALNVLTGQPMPEAQPMAIGELDVNKMISEQRSLTQPVSLKNRLQEYCQRLGKPLPKYTTTFLDQEKFFQSSVDVQGVEYRGEPQKAKKNAETAAAEQALKALELMV